MVATRKGAWLFHGDAARRKWRVDGPHFLGHIFNHIVLDPRDGKTMLADLDRQYPGLRFRVVDEQDRLRGHMRFFVNGEQTFELNHPLRPDDAVQLVQALSGG